MLSHLSHLWWLPYYVSCDIRYGTRGPRWLLLRQGLVAQRGFGLLGRPVSQVGLPLPPRFGRIV